MKPLVYQWSHMLHDYAWLAFADGWYWCPHCRRPVEHATVQREPDGVEELACLDCGSSNSDLLRTIPRPPTAGC